MFRSSLVVRNIARLALGSGLAQAVTIGFAPVLARLYGPEAFGEQGALFSILGPITTLTSMAFPIAIVVARNKQEAAALARLAFLGSLILSLVAITGLAVGDQWLLRQLGLDQIASNLVLIPLLALLTTMNMSSGYLMARGSAFVLAARAQFAAAVVGSGVKLCLGFVSPTALSLIVGNAVGYLAGPFLLWRLNWQSGTRSPRLTVRYLTKVASRHRDFPLLRAPQNFLAAASQSLPIIGLTVAFGSSVAGHYMMAMAVAGSFMSLMGNAAQMVLYPRLTEAVRTGENARNMLLRSTLGLLVVGTVMLLPLGALGENIFEIALGREWAEAGLYAALLSPWLVFGLANRPAVALVPVLGMQRDLLFYEILGSVARAIAVVVGVVFFDSAWWTVALYSATGTAAYAFLIGWIIRITRRQRGTVAGGQAG